MLKTESMFIRGKIDLKRGGVFKLHYIRWLDLDPSSMYEYLVWLQDHVIAGVKMTLRGRFFSRDQYLQLVYQALQGTAVSVNTCIG